MTFTHEPPAAMADVQPIAKATFRTPAEARAAMARDQKLGTIRRTATRVFVSCAFGSGVFPVAAWDADPALSEAQALLVATARKYGIAPESLSPALRHLFERAKVLPFRRP